MKNILSYFYEKFLTLNAKKRFEKLVIYISIISFLVHLVLIFLADLGLIEKNDSSGLLKSPMVAIYTPFSFILLYEAYLLVYYLPKSTTKYIGKQYEIVTLIVIRRIFKDVYNVKIVSNWFSEPGNVLITVDLIAVLVLFYLIYLFNKIVDVKNVKIVTLDVENFINLKKKIATILIPVLIVLSLYNLSFWVYDSFFVAHQVSVSVKNVNKVFFDEFFTLLILVDVLLLLFSFLYTDKFNQVIRNSGFIISTILIKFSFQIEGLYNTIITVIAVLFGLLILYIHNKYDKLEANI